MSKIEITDHKDYKYFCHIWQSIDDILQGISYIAADKDRLDKYYPAYTGSDSSHNLRKTYKEYIKFNPAASESLDTMIGMVLRVAPRIEGIEGHALEQYIETFTGQGLGFSELVKLVLSEVIPKGRIGLYADIKDDRPYCFPYTAQNIPNWVDDHVNLTDRKFVLREDKQILDDEDPFRIALKTQCQKRLIGMTKDGFRVELFKLIEDEWIRDSEAIEFPNYKGIPFDYLPFVIIGSDYNSFSPSTPPFERLVNLIIQYNRHDSDMSFSAAMTDCPMIHFKGRWEEIAGSGSVKIGSGHAKYSEDPQSSIEYVSPPASVNTPQILQRLKDMIASGRNYLTSPRAGIETAEAIKLRSVGDTAKLTGIVSCVAEGLTQIVRIMARMTGETKEQAEELKVILNTDFVDKKIDMSDVSALGTEVEAGRLSWAVYFDNLKQGEMYPDGWTEDMEEEAIEKDKEKMPSLVGLKNGFDKTNEKTEISV